MLSPRRERQPAGAEHAALIRRHFDRYAPERELWERRNRAYYEDLQHWFAAAVPPGMRVLEVGCGMGNLLASLRPSRGLGVDISGELLQRARGRHPQLTFVEMAAEELELDETFDYVVLAGTVGLLTDVQQALQRLRSVCTPRTRLLISFHNFLWEPVLRFGEAVGQRMPLPTHNWLSEADITNLLGLSGFRVVKQSRRLLLPRHLPLVSGWLNRYASQLPGVNALCLTGCLVARLDQAEPRQAADFSCSVIIPARNERANIEPAVQRLPRMGRHTEIIFVEGHSADGTLAEIERVAAAYGAERDISLLRQHGRGKGDAVRQAFAAARGDVLIILDADLTVQPEELPKFFDVITSGRAEFANGCRLVYPTSRDAMPLRNVFANKLFGLAFSWLLGQRFKDTLCGTKALWRRDYERIAAGRAFFGDFDPFGDFDLLFGASKLNLHIADVPVRYVERAYGRSNIQHLRAGLTLLRMCLFASRKIKFT
ncbi:MAG: glycosyltransferase [Chloroflexota bacterium]